jgi:hypothetical protein
MNFFPGIVEDNNDPLKIGRCKVRVIGLYDSLKLSELPWLQCVHPVNYDVVKPPKLGSQVICMAMDQNNQTLLIHGIIPGINDLTNTPDSPRLTRSEELDQTIVQTKSNSRLEDVGSGEWNEPDPNENYGTIYPNNRVIESEAGHVIEIDDSTGKERIQIYHKSGSYLEMLADGSVIIKSIGNNYRIVSGTEYVSAATQVINTGTTTIEVDGECKVEAATVNVKGSTVNIEGSSGIIKGLRCQFTGKPNHNFG